MTRKENMDIVCQNPENTGCALIPEAFDPAVLIPTNKLHNCGANLAEGDAVAHLHEQMRHISNGINAPCSEFPDLK